MTERLYLTYPKALITQPIIYLIGRDFNLVTNIRGANVSEELGLVALEVEGDQNDIDRAIEWLRDRDVSVEPIEKNVIE